MSSAAATPSSAAAAAKAAPAAASTFPPADALLAAVAAAQAAAAKLPLAFAANAPQFAGPVTVLVTGANRGIGLALVERYAKQPHVRVIGTARDLKGASAAALQALVKAHAGKVQAVALDVSDAKSVAALPQALAALQPPVKALDVVINNAGVLSAVAGHDGYSPLALETVDNLLGVFRTNVVGAWDVTVKVLPLLRAAPSKRPQIVNISSVAGQFEFAISGLIPGGGLAYRSSKAALNLLSAVQAREYNHPTVTALAAAAAAPGDAKLQAAAAAADPIVGVLALHPGLIDTEIQGQQSAFEIPKVLMKSPADSAEAIDKVWRQNAAAAVPNAQVQYIDAITGQLLPW